MDADFYDNLQWSPDDAQILKDRGQMPLVFNEVAPMVDWLIGTQRRTAVDWRVLPRSEDDVDAWLSQRRRLLSGSLHVQMRSWQLGLDVRSPGKLANELSASQKTHSLSGNGSSSTAKRTAFLPKLPPFSMQKFKQTFRMDSVRTFFSKKEDLASLLSP
jgi:hypothetical protein